LRIVKRYSFHDRRKGNFSLIVEISNGGLQTTTRTATARRRRKDKVSVSPFEGAQNRGKGNKQCRGKADEF